jgi:hypothetical protein
LLDEDEDFDDGYAALIDDGVIMDGGSGIIDGGSGMIGGGGGGRGGGGAGGGLRWGGGGAGSTTGLHASPLTPTGSVMAGAGSGMDDGMDESTSGIASGVSNMSVESLGGSGDHGEWGHQRQRHSTWWGGFGSGGGGGGGGGGGAGEGLSAFVAAGVRGCSKAASVLSVIAEAPVLTALRATMPDLGADPRRQSRLLTSLLPVTAPLFFITVERVLPTVVTPAGAAYGAVCGSIGAVSLYCAWPVLTGPDAPRRAVRIMDGVLTALAFVLSVTWMDATAGELVALLAAIGKISGVSETLLGATVLAWGNSVGDMVANTTVAREGRPAMAIAACFAGPLFNLLMGRVGTFHLILHFFCF